MRTQFSKIAYLAALVLALAFTFGCSSDDNPSNNQPNINSGSEISSSSGGGGSGSSSGNSGGALSSSGGNSSPATGGSSSSGSLSSSGGNSGSSSSGSIGSSSSSNGNTGSSSSSNGNTGFSSSSLGQSSSAVLKECDAIFNPDNKFCYDGNVYDKCGGKVYSPASEICQYGQVTTAKCNNGDSYNPLTQSCCGSIAILSNSTTERCTNGVAEAKCGSIWYKQTTQFCYNDVVYDKCNGINNYNPLTQGCVNNKIVETKCGNSWYDQAIQFCVDNKLYDKCDGMVYPPATHICVNNLATPAKCNGESYNPLTQFCHNNIIYAKCNGENYNPFAQYCENGTAKNRDFIDTRDNKKYKFTIIGTQTWMAENLNYNASGSRCCGEAGPSNLLSDKNTTTCDTYGRLYDWTTAMDLSSSCNNSICASQISTKHKGICPSGWHIPSDAEWTTLIDFVGGSNTAGTKLKATNGWNTNSNYKAGTDDFGFTALPGGYGGPPANGNSFGFFYSVGYSGHWWSSSESGTNNAYRRYITYEDEKVFRNDSYKNNSLYSVRCVKD